MDMTYHRIPTKTPTNRPKAYSYIRFSTPEQAQGDSKRRQMDLAVKYAQEHGLDLQDKSYEDLGVSAFRSANAETGELGTFLQAVRLGQVEQGSWLLIESLDRLSRAKPRKAVRLMEDIVEAGIVLVTLADQKVYDKQTIDDDPMTFMWAFMVAIRANEESATKSRRLKQAWANKRRNAGQRKLTAMVPSWLRLNDDRMGFTVLEDKAATVRRIFDLAVKGTGHMAIARTLNRDAVPTLDRGQQWHKSVIVKVLRSEAVIGTYQPHTIETDERNRKVRKAAEKVPGYYPAIVDERTYFDVQLLGSVKATRGRHAKSGTVKNVLAGLAQCPVCGGSMTRVVKNQKDIYLTCVKAKAGAGCEYKAVRYGAVNYAIMEGPISWLDDMEAGGHTGDVDPVYDRVTEVGTRIQRITQAIIDGGSSVALRTALDRAEAEKAEAEQAVRELEERLAATSGPIIEERTMRLREARAAGDVQETNRLLKLLCSSVVVDWKGGEVAFNWRHGTQTRAIYTTPEG